MSLGMSPGIVEDFGAVQSSTTPSGESAEGLTQGGTRFDDLVDAWLAPDAADDATEAAADAAGTAVAAVPATLPLPFPLPLPLPGPVRVPVSVDDPAGATEPVEQGQPLVTVPPTPPASCPVMTAATDAVPPTGGAPVDTGRPAAPAPFAVDVQVPAPETVLATDAPRPAVTVTEQSRADRRADRSEASEPQPVVDDTRDASSARNPFSEVTAPDTTTSPVREERRETSTTTAETQAIRRVFARASRTVADGALYTAEKQGAERKLAEALESAVPVELLRPGSAGDAVVVADRSETGQSRSAADNTASGAPAVPDAAPKAAETSIADPAGELRTNSKGAAQPSAGAESRAAKPAEQREQLPAGNQSLLPSARRVDAKVITPATTAPPVAPAASAPSAAKYAAAPVDSTGASQPVPIELPPVPRGTGERRGQDERRPAGDEQARDASDRPVAERAAIASALPIADRAEAQEAPASPAAPARSSAVTLLHGAAPVALDHAPLPALAAADSAAPAAALAPDTADRIVQSLRFQVARGGGDAVLHLQPEHLGPVAISLRVGNGAVSAVITADHPAVAEWLQSNQQSLREALEASGLQLERFIVQRDGQSPSDRQRREWLEARRRDFRRRAPQTDSTFEISA
jgi:flagellar hook-length control protein FliK